MNVDRTADRTVRPNQPQAWAVRFPLPTNRKPAAGKQRPRLSDLLPGRWRRCVVIQGQRFWLPG